MDGSPLSSEFWSWVWETYKAWVWETYKVNREAIIALLTIMGGVIGASITAWLMLKRDRKARLRDAEQIRADLQRRINENFMTAVDQLSSDMR
jgi:hypothetical protein